MMQKCHDSLVYLITVTSYWCDESYFAGFNPFNRHISVDSKEAPLEYQSYHVQVTKYQTTHNMLVMLLTSAIPFGIAATTR